MLVFWILLAAVAGAIIGVTLVELPVARLVQN